MFILTGQWSESARFICSVMSALPLRVTFASPQIMSKQALESTTVPQGGALHTSPLGPIWLSPRLPNGA